MHRPEIFERIRAHTEPWDIIVIGGGATGVGCALDAASRGYLVLLLEQHDFGKGTSSRSTKLIHGGVRYLAQGNVSLVRESLTERAVLIRNAPHVVRKQAFIVPCYGLWQKMFYGAGLRIYDLLAGKYGIGRSSILSKSETVKRIPSIKTKGLTGGILYYDGQFDDTRLLTDMVTTAHAQGACVVNYAKVIGFLESESGGIIGVHFEDIESGDKHKILGRCVINATGAFCDSVRTLSNAASKPVVALSQGIHLVLARRFLPSDTAMMIPKTRDGRVLFCIPWHGHTLVGTTDTPIQKAELEPKALAHEIDFVLETAGEYLTQKPTLDDILSVFAGIRPLVQAGAAKSTASLSRGHTIEIDQAGLLSITGGKWTTYRRMAEDAVNQAADLAGLEHRPSKTDELRISGPTAASALHSERLHPDLPYTRADVIRAVRDEMARTVEDVLARRTRTLFLHAAVSVAIAPQVAEIMMKELGKDELWAARQIADFTAAASNYTLA